MRFARRSGRDRVAPLEITPMIDVVFLLIIFFMTAARFAQETRADVELPKERGEQQTESEEAGLVVNVDARGAILVGADTLELADVEEMVRAEIATVAGGDPRGVKLLLRVDHRADSAHLNRIIELLQDLGVGTARVATEVP